MISRHMLASLLGASLIAVVGCGDDSSDDPSNGGSGTGGAGAASGTGGAGAAAGTGGAAAGAGGVGPGSCQYAGDVVADGSSFPAEDGCNTCTCSDGAVACTEMACAPSGGTGGAGSADCAGQACGAQACSIEVQCFVPPCDPVPGWCDAAGQCVDVEPTCP